MKPIFSDLKWRKTPVFVIVFERNGHRDRDVLYGRAHRHCYEQMMRLRTFHHYKLLYRINVVPK